MPKLECSTFGMLIGLLYSLGSSGELLAPRARTHLLDLEKQITAIYKGLWPHISPEQRGEIRQAVAIADPSALTLAFFDDLEAGCPR